MPPGPCAAASASPSPRRSTPCFPNTFARAFRFPWAGPTAICEGITARTARTFVATPSLAERLRNRGFTNLAIWPRGVDTNLFKPGPKSFLPGPRPLSMYMGRVAVEKNIEAFLDLDLPGTKYVVGDGPRPERPAFQVSGRPVRRTEARGGVGGAPGRRRRVRLPEA